PATDVGQANPATHRHDLRMCGVGESVAMKTTSVGEADISAAIRHEGAHTHPLAALTTDSCTLGTITVQYGTKSGTTDNGFAGESGAPYNIPDVPALSGDTCKYFQGLVVHFDDKPITAEILNQLQEIDPVWTSLGGGPAAVEFVTKGTPGIDLLRL